MKIYDPDDRIPQAVYGLGVFDGVHLGHAELINRVKDVAKMGNTLSALFIFDPSPALYFVPDLENYQITTIDEKLKLLEEYGLDHVVVLSFNDEIKKLSPIDFFNEVLLDKLNVKGVVCGSNYHFGNDKHGDSAYLALLCFDHRIPCEILQLKKQNEVISSSAIRTHIHSDNYEAAKSMLGRDYSLSGKVVRGKDMGKKIGFPTANMEVSKYKLLPNPGIYKVNVELSGKKYKGVMHYGATPTIDNSGKKQLEVHILDFSGDIYGEYITLEILSRVRDIVKFNGIDELKAAIAGDIAASWG